MSVLGTFAKAFLNEGLKLFGEAVTFLSEYRRAGGQDPNGGGWGLERFNSVVNAHSSPMGIVDEFELNQEECEYMSVDGYENPYMQAYEEEYERAERQAEMMQAAGMAVDPEDLMNWERVEKDALRYALQLANAWLDGSEWIPEEVMDWAWYDLSGHNG